MDTNVPIDEDLLRKAMELSQATDPAKFLRELLELDIVQREAGLHLIALGGSMPDYETPRRQRNFEPPTP